MICSNKLVINLEFHLTTIALNDIGADQNCIQERLIPTKYYEKKTKEKLSAANNTKIQINYKLSKVKICNQGFCFHTQFILIKHLYCPIILRAPFITITLTSILGNEVIYPIQPKQVDLLKKY